ncbi:hypothetical protein MtrunA17_Chr8g0368721 [Medicago truncatula]|nr:hypothetical protein MtrunA17_Chr8g0368721 [Medicago truncatula]
MDNDNCDLFSIVRSCKATTFATPTTNFETLPPTLTTTTNNIISPQNTTPCFDYFSFFEDNSSAPITPLKPNDFIELEKLIININPTTTIPTPTITSIPTITTTPTTTPTPSSTNIPSHITTNTITNTSFHDSNQNSTFSNFPKLIEQQQLELNEFTELEKMILKFYPNTTIPTSTITAPTPTTTIFTTPTTIIPTTTFATLTTSTPIIPTITTTMTTTSVCKTNQYLTISDYQILIEQQRNEPNRNNEVSVSEPHTRTEIATSNFDCAFNHPSIPQQSLRKRNQLPFLLPRTNSRFLPNTHPKKPKFKSRKR